MKLPLARGLSLCSAATCGRRRVGSSRWPLLVLATIGLRLANPQILRQFIDTATAGGARSRA